MVLPSIKYFCERMDWLNKATKSGWPEDLKEAKPTSEIGKSPARPRQVREITKVSLYSLNVKTLKFFKDSRGDRGGSKKERRAAN